MALKYSIKLSQLMDMARSKIEIEDVRRSSDYDSVLIDDSNLNRPGDSGFSRR